MLQARTDAADASRVLGRAATRAAEKLGRDRTTISRRGIDPLSKPGELALMLIRCYRSLAVLVDDDKAQIRHWMRTENRHTGGIPIEQIRSVAGLVAVTGYLDAIRGRI